MKTTATPKMTPVNLFVLGRIAAGESVIGGTRAHARRLLAAGLITETLALTDAGRALLTNADVVLGLKGRPVVR